MKSIHSSSIDRILEISESSKSVFRSIERDSASIRETYVSKRYPHSIANMSAVTTESLYDVIGAGRQIKNEERGEKVLIDDLASDFKVSTVAQGNLMIRSEIGINLWFKENKQHPIRAFLQPTAAKNDLVRLLSIFLGSLEHSNL
jgi:hypothetical protein